MTAAAEVGLPHGPLTLVIEGEPASKENSREPVWNFKAKRVFWAKSPKARAYAAALAHQVPRIDPLLKGDLVLTITLYYASNRPDLDESLILDGLQGRIYKNDRQVREKHIYHGIDRARPRAEITIHAREPGLIGKVA